MQEPLVPSMADDQVEPAVASTPHCRRCSKPITDPEQEELFRQTGLCFWCAYVDAQG